MKIGIDAHMLGQGEGGNETGARGLIEALTRLDSQNHYYLFVEDLANLPDQIQGRSNVTVVTLPTRSSVRRLLLEFPRLVKKYGLDLLHITSYNAPPFCPCPLVVTVYDISFERFPEWFSGRDRLLLGNMVPRSIKKARRVFVPSEFTRDEMLEIYNPSPEKIVVTPCGVLTHFQPINDKMAWQEIRQKYGIANDFILAVGNIQPRKNLIGLIQAFAILKSQGLASMPLVMVGKSRWQVREVYQAVEANNLENQIIFTGYVPEQDLVLLYNAAKVFVYPSFYEGFGLPVLEAMACGTPVITSNRASLPWVAGEAALLIDPDKPNELAEALTKVLTNDNLAKEMSRKGLEQAARFSWDDTATLTLAAYQVAANRKGL